MRCRSFVIAITSITLTLLTIRLGTEAAAAKDWPPGPCSGKQPKPHCGRGSTAVCTRPSAGACGCMRWTCAFEAPKPPMTKEPFNAPKTLPGRGGR